MSHEEAELEEADHEEAELEEADHEEAELEEADHKEADFEEAGLGQKAGARLVDAVRWTEVVVVLLVRKASYMCWSQVPPIVEL